MLDAIKLNDLPAIKALLALGAKANLEGQYYVADIAGSQSPFSIAIAKELIKAGAPIEIETHWASPLTSAVLAGNKEMVQYLLKLGVDPNRTQHGQTPLAAAEQILSDNPDTSARANELRKAAKEIVVILKNWKAKLSKKVHQNTPLPKILSDKVSEYV